MQQPDVARLRGEVLTNAGFAEPTSVEVLHSWELSHVERLTCREGGSVIFKCASEPFAHENDALIGAWQAGVAVPRVHAWARTATVLGMIMDDLGQPQRPATDADGVTAAAQLHCAAVSSGLPPADGEWLASLPSRALRTIELLQENGRWSECDDIAAVLRQLEKEAGPRAEGATKPPYGWVHSEFHPESVLVSSGRVYMFDLARAFRGPGLLDLASWHGSVDEPDPQRTRSFIDAYVRHGGPAEALDDRGGLAAEDWALGWHRVWALEWFLAQSLVWINNPADDPAYANVVRRHALDAAQLLRV